MTNKEYQLIKKALNEGADFEHEGHEGRTCDEESPCVFCLALGALSREVFRKRKVRIEVLGGVAEVTRCARGVNVQIIDHDNEKAG